VKRSKEELLSAISAILGDNTSDEALTIIEDISDSFETSQPDEDWKVKYDQLDADWRKRYKERFFSEGTTHREAVEEQEENVKEDGEKKTYDELFEEREG
jgi:hypothetical protein